MSIRPKTSAHSAMSRNCRKFARRNAPTARVYQPVAAGRLPTRSVGVRRRAVPVVVRPLAEQRPSDPDDRRALLDGDLEVVGHAHRQLGTEPSATGPQALGQLPQRGERRPRCLGARPRAARSS